MNITVRSGMLAMAVLLSASGAAVEGTTAETVLKTFGLGTLDEKKALQDKLLAEKDAALPTLQKALEQSGSAVPCWWILKTMGGIGSPAAEGVPPSAEVVDAMKDQLRRTPYATVRVLAARFLAQWGNGDGEPALAGALLSAEPLDRLQAMHDLRAVGGALSVPPLIENLSYNDPAIREEAFRTLMEITGQSFGRDAALRSRLPDLANDPEYKKISEELERVQQDVRARAGATGRRASDEETHKQQEALTRKMEILLSAFQKTVAETAETREQVRSQWQAWWEAHKGQTRVEWMAEALSNPDVEAACLAARALARVGGPAETRALMAAVANPSAPLPLRIACCRTAAVLAESDAADALLAALEKTAAEPAPAEAERKAERMRWMDALAGALRQLTGGRLPADAAAWRAWWDRTRPLSPSAGLPPAPIPARRALSWRTPGTGGPAREFLLIVPAPDFPRPNAPVRVELRRWLPVEKKWFGKEYEVQPGQAVGNDAERFADAGGEAAVPMGTGLALSEVKTVWRDGRHWAVLTFQAGSETLSMEIPAAAP